MTVNFKYNEGDIIKILYDFIPLSIIGPIEGMGYNSRRGIYYEVKDRDNMRLIILESEIKEVIDPKLTLIVICDKNYECNW